MTMRITIELTEQLAARIQQEGARSTVVPRVLRRYFADLDRAAARLEQRLGKDQVARLHGQPGLTAAETYALMDLEERAR